MLLLRAVWQRKHTEIYKILRELPWPERSEPIVQRYESEEHNLELHICEVVSNRNPDYFQEKTLEELSNSFETIRIAAAAKYLGIDPAVVGDSAIIEKLKAYGWKWDSETQLLHPKPIVTAPPKDDSVQNELSRVMSLISDQGS